MAAAGALARNLDVFLRHAAAQQLLPIRLPEIEVHMAVCLVQQQFLRVGERRAKPCRDLRTDLVYRLRIVVAHPGKDLRQGMPVTVRLPPRLAGSAS